MTGCRATFDYRVEQVPYSVAVYEGVGLSVEQFERGLDERGAHLPLCHRAAWLEAFAPPRTLVFCVASSNGPEIAFAAEIERARAVPGHRIFRVKRLGSGVAPSAVRAGLRALRDFVAAEPRILRVHVELFGRDGDARSRAARELQEAGFRQAREPRAYSATVAIELQGDEQALLESLHRTARRKIRALERDPLQVRPVTDPACAARLQELVVETMARTGGTVPRPAWERLMALGVEQPSLLRILGTFSHDAEEPDSLLAFAVMLRHGDHVEYSWSGSTRRTEVRAPLAYGLIWRAMLWAHDAGASWFDFGGITPGSAADGSDPLGGISDFKRSFSKNVVSVGEEWVLEPNPLRAAFADGVHRGAQVIRAWGRGRGRQERSPTADEHS